MSDDMKVEVMTNQTFREPNRAVATALTSLTALCTKSDQVSLQTATRLDHLSR